MTNSASAAGTDRRTTIISCAQQLAVRCGYSGFTFDDLAQAVGVSRRTLFNHVSSKEEAVLGALPAVSDEQLEVLADDGPSGQLVTTSSAPSSTASAATATRSRPGSGCTTFILRNPELLARIQSFVDDLSSHLVTHLTRRTGVDEDTAWMALTVAGGVVGRSVRDCVDDPTLGPLHERVEHNLSLTRGILAARR